MLTSKNRIKKILDFETPDRVGLMDMFWDETRAAWGETLQTTPEEFFDFDIRLFDLEKKITKKRLDTFFSPALEDRFLALSFSEPFQKYADKVGLQNALEDVAKDPKRLFRAFKKDLDTTLTRAVGILDKGYRFDGLWLFGDLAHQRGPFFSEEFYRRYLFPFHKEISYFFASYGVPTILHSDGNITDFIPYLIEAGFRALHPLQASAGLDAAALKREYKNEIVLCGNIDITLAKTAGSAGKDRLIERVHSCKEGGAYIFGLDGPVGPDIGLEEYKLIQEIVKEHGKY
ncbi:MAG: uroporphyrinogen decarboxylase family protein [Candidatus Omnitrophota bacterium]